MQIGRIARVGLITIGCLLSLGARAQEAPPSFDSGRGIEVPPSFDTGRAIFACANLAVMKGDMEAADRLGALGYETLRPLVAERHRDTLFAEGWPYLVQFSDDFLIGGFWGLEALQMAILLGDDYRVVDVEAEYIRRNCGMLT